MIVPYPKRLIEVDLPIKRISAHARREKSLRDGHISTLHIWWARRPLAACRAVILAALWPDPAGEMCPGSFRREARERMLAWARHNAGKASAESFERLVRIQKNADVLDDPIELRACLLDFIADFSDWDNSRDKEYLETSRALVQASHAALGTADGGPPRVVDPFAGGGAIPLEALRVGANAFASDLNPLPVLLNRVVVEHIPAHRGRLTTQFRLSAKRIRTALEAELSPHYGGFAPDAETPFAYFWARTITCEGPGCGLVFPLLRSCWLRQKTSKPVALSLRPVRASLQTTVEIISNPESVQPGTSKQGAATCPLCGYTTPVESVRRQLSGRRGGASDALALAVAVTRKDSTGKTYRRPTDAELRSFASASALASKLGAELIDGLRALPDEPINHLRGFFNVVLYGMTTWGDLFAPRQALLLITIARMIREEYARLRATEPELAGPVANLLALCAGKVAQYNSSCCRWKPTGETLVDMFGRQAMPMVWDFAEAYPFGRSTGDFGEYADNAARVLEENTEVVQHGGSVRQASATAHPLPNDTADLLFTDPPYYDAIPYADLSDFFYVWLRRTVRVVDPTLFAEPLAPKADECVMLAHRAAAYRHKDRHFFEATMTAAATEARRVAQPLGLGVFVFANKSTGGWEAMLAALHEAGWTTTASWPIDTEMSSRLRAQRSAVLASSVHIVCRPRENADGSLRIDAIGDWRDVLAELPKRIHAWMPRLANEGVVGADAIFACLGPALEIFSQYSRVEKASGEQVMLKEYLEHVWAAVAKEALSMIFAGAETSGFEEDARLTAMWLWTFSTGASNGTSAGDDDDEDDSEDEGGDGKTSKKAKLSGFALEYDAARKIAQGLGAHLEDLTSLVEVRGETARLLPVAERTRALFGKNEGEAPSTRRKKKTQQMKLGFAEELEEAEEAGGWGQKGAPRLGDTVLDRVHQSMILFAAGRGEALRRFLVDEGAGRDARYWRLAQAFAALYPAGTDERRWVEGVLARKKGLGF